MLVKIVGIKSIEYTKKGTDKLVKGKEMHITREPLTLEKDSFQGQVTDKVYISAAGELYDRLTPGFVGQTVELRYEYDGRFTHLVGIDPVKASA